MNPGRPATEERSAGCADLRTYGNLMVDGVTSNEKLRARARRTVELAIVSLLTGLGPAASRARLDAAGGAIRRAAEEA